MLAECQSHQIVVSPSRQSVERIEAYLHQFPQIDVKTEHKFAPGVYIRQITFPAGVIATGAACKHDHLSVMVCGHMHVLADGAVRDLSGYHEWIAKAGIKRVGISIEETVWFTVHPNPDDETDLNVLEARYFEQPEMLQRRRVADGLLTLEAV